MDVKKGRWKIIIAVVLLLSGCAHRDENETSEMTTESVVPIQVVQVEKKEIYDKIEALGEIKAKAVYEISAGLGTVEELYVVTGQSVDKNQVLFELETDSLEKNYKAVESQLRTLRDTLKIQRDDQERTYTRQTALFEAGAVSKRELENAKLAYDQLEKQYQDALVAYSNQVTDLKNGIEDYQVKSPIQGKVAAVHIKSGQDVQGQTAVEIIDDSSVKAVIGVTAQQVKLIEPGDGATVYANGESHKGMAAYVDSINAIPSTTTGLYEVQLMLEDNTFDVRTGEYVEVEILINVRKVLVIPRNALIMTGEMKKAFVVENGHAVEKSLTTGSVEGLYIEVEGGLNEGEEVVVRGQAFLKEGSAVEIIQ